MGSLKFEKLLNEQWRSLNKNVVDIRTVLSPYTASDDLNIHIGTDAQKGGGKFTNFVVCICVHEIGRGGRVFYLKFKNILVSNLWEKLYNETMLSLQVAVELTEIYPELRQRILVHVDANPDKRYASSDHVQALAGMIVGYGFKHILKPDAWASSHAADHLVKNKNSKR